MLTIETERQTTEAQAKEIVNVSMQIKRILKAPDKKITNYFKFCPRSMIFCGVMLVLSALYIIKFGGDALIYVCLGMMAITLVTTLKIYISVNNYKKHLLGQKGKVTVIFDENGVDYDNHKDRKLNLSWEGTAFIRIFSECLYVVPKDITSVMICLKKDDAERVAGFITENNINIEIIR